MAKKSDKKSSANESILTSPRIVKLSDGRELTCNLYLISITEYREMLSVTQADDEGDEMLARVYGLGIEEIRELSFPDYRLLVDKFKLWAYRPYDEEDSSKN